ncbi:MULTISPECIES: Crp/Fnr family transcriptional regulator [unclassified Fusibacter]|uniref:Crp/Fnr family transcriptional regulator n=1 Tax=unclassified Fusibacter TaxID=2624464 RepID=UPI00101395D7|nr:MULTISPECIES: cyclic nucleotide-binding domain-containing protein [unclassified Fusibacter]MCK8058509.1 cyclic nucleotide-binding domain-containing protein [Fusibacter sp. A2]NPE22722.1 cyclic nucleotide-binding domain-containing protein [Fusibacter sp. A1]RXV60282.1 cyclic nucleotide-binding domain-containing protein [Fusibacter sp. A1]
MNIQELKKIGKIECYGEDEKIFQQGEIGDSLFIILKGSVNVVITSSYDGNEILASVIKEGNIFGEMALVSDSRRGATIRTNEETTCLRIGQAKFDTFISQEPSIIVKMLKIMANRYYETIKQSKRNEEITYV